MDTLISPTPEGLHTLDVDFAEPGGPNLTTPERGEHAWRGWGLN